MTSAASLPFSRPAREPVAMRADLAVARDGFLVEARLDIAAGESVAVLGPNGAGKSTLLAGIAGLLPVAAGEIELGGRVLERSGGTRERPERRRVALLEQKPRLFPHLSVAANIAFGPRAQGRSRAEARGIAAEWLDRLGLADRARERPHRLSGGQQQRVAIARAFAADPELLLLDEPLAALDAPSTRSLRRMLREELTRTGTTSIVVTHDLSDAWQWSERCLVLDHGQVIEEGSPTALSTTPRSLFTATLAGFGSIRGIWTGKALETDFGTILAESEPGLRVGSPAVGIVAPRSVSAYAAATDGALALPVDQVSVRAGVVRIAHADLAAEMPLPAAVDTFGGIPRIDETVWLTPRGLRVLAA